MLWCYRVCPTIPCCRCHSSFVAVVATTIALIAAVPVVPVVPVVMVVRGELSPVAQVLLECQYIATLTGQFTVSYECLPSNLSYLTQIE